MIPCLYHRLRQEKPTIHRKPTQLYPEPEQRTPNSTYHPFQELPLSQQVLGRWGPFWCWNLEVGSLISSFWEYESTREFFVDLNLL